MIFVNFFCLICFIQIQYKNSKMLQILYLIYQIKIIESMDQQEVQAYQYVLTIQSVKMKVKFPCKMKLQHNGNPLTTQVPTSQANKFIFNQQVTVREQTDKPCFEITIVLITDKGGKYTSGILKFFHNQLVRSEGETIVVPITKCLDGQASCQLRIDQVSKTKQMRKTTIKNSGVKLRSQMQPQYGIQRIGSESLKIKRTDNEGQTKSQVHFPLPSKRKTEWQDTKTRVNAQSNFNNQGNFSPRSNIGMRRKTVAFENVQARQDKLSAIGDRDKLIEAQVYKQGYEKLKEKYKKQTQNAKNELNKRISLQNSENNLKLEIMRLRLRNEEQEKSITDKTQKIKELQNQISSFQKKQLDLVYLKEQYSNKDHAIKMLEDTNRSLTIQLEDLRVNMTDKSLVDQQIIKDLKRNLQSLKSKSDQKQTDLQKQLRMKMEIIRTKDAELSTKNELLSRQKKLVEELEKDSQNKLLDYEKNLQAQKTASRAKIEQLKVKVDKLQKQKSLFEQERTEQKDQLQKTKAIILKYQYENKILSQEIQSLKSQLTEMKIYKDKHGQLARDLKLTTDDKNHLQKQLERALQNKQVNISQLSKQHQEQIDYFKKINKELDDKNKNFSTRILELQGQLEISRGAQEKVKRSQQALTIQLNQARQREKNYKKTIKSKQQEILALESDISNTKNKSKNNQHFMKNELDQYKQQLNRTKEQLEEMNLKNAQLTDNNTQINVELGKVKVRLQFMEQKSEKDTLALLEKKQQIEGLLKDQQIQLNSLNDTINLLRETEKDLISKIQKQEIETIRIQDKYDRTNKQAKLLEQKLNAADGNIKNRQGENSSLLAMKNDLQSRVNQLEQQLNSFKNQTSQLQAEKNKNLKMIEIMRQQNSKCKKDIEKLKHTVEDREKDIDSLNNQIKRNKEQITKIQMKLSTANNDYQRFRQTTMENIITSFSNVITDGKRHLGGSLVESVVSSKNLNSSSATPSQINHLITNYSKDSKLAINKLGQQVKQLQRENDRLNDELTGSINKGQNSEFELTKQLNELQEELTQSYAERDEENIKFDQQLKQLNSKIREREREISQLNQHIQQLNFSLNTLKLDNDAQTDQNVKKNTQMNRYIEELQEKNQFLTITITNLQEKAFQLETERQSVLAELKQQRQNSNKKDRILSQSQELTVQLQRLLQENKKQKKQLNEKLNQIQFQLNAQKDHNQKMQQLLEDEQSKGSELKTFINNLMKQKQNVIKSQLKKGQQIITLETTILQITRDRDILQEQCDRLKRQIEEGKDSNKKLSTSGKELEMRLLDEKTKASKLSEKLKEKQKQLITKQQIIDQLQSKYSRLSDRTTKQANELRQQLQAKTAQIIENTRQNAEKIYQYEKQKQIYETNISQLKMEVLALQQQIFNQQQQAEGANTDNVKLNSQMEKLKGKIRQLQMQVEALNEELKQKDEVTFQLQNKIYNMQGRIEAKEAQKNDKLDILDHDWVCKYDGMCQEYQQRLQLVQTQRQYFKNRMSELQQQIQKLTGQKNNFEIQQNKRKSILQQKIKKLQEQRLQLASQKNSQIQKQTQEIKSQITQVKSKDTQMRKLQNQLEIVRSMMTKMESKYKQNEEKLKNMNKVYEAQLEQHRKRQQYYNNFKEGISVLQWTAERQVKKVIQGFIKKVIQTSEENRGSQKILESVKNMEQNVITAMKLNIDQIKI